MLQQLLGDLFFRYWRRGFRFCASSLLLAARSLTHDARRAILILLWQCDLDRSGSISLEEYVYFCDRQGVPRSTAEITFFKADCDGDGTDAVCQVWFRAI